jgi:methyl-accepting chemotaxis protein
VNAVPLKESDQRVNRMLHAEHAHADAVLSKLLVAHLPFAIGLAALHGYWILALVAGSALSFIPLWVVHVRPGTLASRLTVAAGFMGYSALLIQEAHGATEMHFHVFGALAFLLLYRDWRAPAFAGVIIAVHHLVFHFLQAAGTGVWVFPASWAHANGIEMVGVHAGFVIFEVVVLVYISQSLAP